MPDAPADAHGAGQAAPRAEATASDEDFVYHLYRGSELLMDGRVVEAKGEIERALSVKPQDAKGQDLLAAVYFRLGVYPRAIEIWDRLVRAYPRDATLRVNLSLALLKTGQPGQALEHIQTALELSPEHERAWGYLGLIHWRAGRYEEARQAFLRGGQAAMARRMEELIAAGTTAAGGLSALVEQEPTGSKERAAMRLAAEQAIERFEAEQVPLSVEESAPRRPSGAWRVGEPGVEPTPRARAPRAVTAPAPPSLGSLVDRWTVSLPDETPLAVGPTGQLHLVSSGDVYCRSSGLVAVRGELRTTSVRRRARGRELAEVLGGDDPVLLWRGPVAAILEPPAGRSFHGVSLVDDILFVREELLAAFDDGLGFESGRVPLARGELVMLSLHGTGTVVLRLPRSPTALPVAEGEEVRVVPSSLVGWTGRLLPRGPRARGTAPYGANAPALAFRGEGVVMVA